MFPGCPETPPAARRGWGSCIAITGTTLSHSQAKLCTYTGQAIDVMGTADIRVEHNDQTATLSLFVTRGKGPSLLGRNWLETLRLDWKKIFLIQNETTLQEVLDRYSDVFQDELGTMKGVTAKIHLDSKATSMVPQSQISSFCLTSWSGGRAGMTAKTRHYRAHTILRLGSTHCTCYQK